MKILISIHCLVLASGIPGVIDEILPGKAFLAREDELNLVDRGAARYPTDSEEHLPLAVRAGATDDAAVDAVPDIVVDAEPTVAADADGLKSLYGLTVSELGAVAEAEGIDLGKARRRDDIVIAIEAARADNTDGMI